MHTYFNNAVVITILTILPGASESKSCIPTSTLLIMHEGYLFWDASGILNISECSTNTKFQTYEH